MAARADATGAASRAPEAGAREAITEHVPKKTSAPKIIARSRPAGRWFLRDDAAELGDDAPYPRGVRG